MNKIIPKNLKGFRDFLPNEARKRKYVIDTLKNVFESYGFEPLETPTLEYEEILAGKYGEEGDRLMYKFEDLGERKVALRYDQTVPLARVVAQYANALPFPFKRYQIQNVWRAENTQKGRFREFLQCDIDTVGATAALADAEIIELVSSALLKLGFEKFKILVNDRSLFDPKNFKIQETKLPAVIRALDKLKKIGKEGVISEMVEAAGLKQEQAEEVLAKLEETQPTERLKEVIEKAKLLGVREDNIEFFPTLARGLDYYTSTIIEVEIEGYDAGSIGGGGRYDNLIGMFTNQTIPAVGFAFGFDRLIEAMETFNLFPKDLKTNKVLVTIFSPDLLSKSVELCEFLNQNNINQELYIDENAKLEKQLKYADKKGIKYVLVLGPEEVSGKKVTVKNLETRTQVTIDKNDLLNVLA